MPLLAFLTVLLWPGDDIAAPIAAEIAARRPDLYVTPSGAGIVRPESDPAARLAARRIIDEAIAGAPAMLTALRHDELVPLLESGVGALLAAASDPSDAALLFDALVWIGRAHEELGHRDDAVSALARAAAIDPEATLDPARYSPPVLAAWQEARARALAERAAHVVLRWLPPAAELFVDGRAVPGDGAATLDLPPGVHVAWLRAEGHRPATLRLDTAAELPRLIVLRPEGPPAEAGLARAAARRLDIESVAVLGRDGDGLRIAVAGESRVVEASAAAVEQGLQQLLAGPPPAASAPPRERRRRAWPWALGAAVIAGAVLTAVLVARQNGSGGCPDDVCIPF